MDSFVLTGEGVEDVVDEFPEGERWRRRMNRRRGAGRAKEPENREVRQPTHRGILLLPNRLVKL